MSEANNLYPGHWAAQTPDKPAVIMAESGDSMSFAELDDAANRLSNVFADAGFKPGDHISFCMENRIEYLAVMWGAHYAGLYYTAISSRLTTEELAYIIEDSGSRGFLTTPHMSDSLSGLEDALSKLDIRLSIGGDLPGFDRYEDALEAASPKALPDRIEAAPMLYSSGTTGRPKGIKPQLTGDPLGRGEALTALVQHLFGANNESIYISPAPLYHSAPCGFCTGTLALGGTVILMPRFNEVEALKAIETYKVTHSQWVPTMFSRMLKMDEAERSNYDLSSHKIAIHAAIRINNAADSERALDVTKIYTG